MQVGGRGLLPGRGLTVLLVAEADPTVPRLPAAATMASRWRRRPVCRLDGAEVVLLSVSATGATLATSLRPPLGARVALDHPEAGSIAAEVSATMRGGLRLTFAGDAQAMGFALAALAADMSVVEPLPGAQS